MSLANRIIPTMLVLDGQLVVSRQFKPWRIVGHPEQAVRVNNARNVDELILLDIGTYDDGPNLGMIGRLAEQAFMPITVGGRVRDTEDVAAMLAAGADKVAIGRLLRERPAEVERCALRFGSQALVGIVTDPTIFQSGVLAEAQAAQAVDAGVGEILLQSISRDGMLEGYELPAIEVVCQAVDVPVIASSGCGGYWHMDQALCAGASAVAAGAMFHYTGSTPSGAADYLGERGWTVRQ